jgi:hypothetical protein
MITKRKHFYKPIPKYEKIFKSNYIKSLYGLRKTCLNLHIKKLAIPRIGCNCDQLSWDKFMKPSILEIFNTVPIEILVCNSTPRTPRTKANATHVSPCTSAGRQPSPPSTPLSRKSHSNKQIKSPTPPRTPPSIPSTPSPPHTPPPPTTPLACSSALHQKTSPVGTLPTSNVVSHVITPRSHHSNNGSARLNDKCKISVTASQNDSNNSTPTYTNLTNMIFYTPQPTDSNSNSKLIDKTIELSDSQLGYTISQKNIIQPIPFPTL